MIETAISQNFCFCSTPFSSSLNYIVIFINVSVPDSMLFQCISIWSHWKIVLLYIFSPTRENIDIIGGNRHYTSVRSQSH